MSLVGFVQYQNGEIQQKIFVRFGGFVVWGFTFRGLELYFSGFGTLLFVDSKWDSWFGTIFWGEMVGK